MALPDEELQVQRQCGDEQQLTDIVAYVQYDRDHWKSDNVTIEACSGAVTKVRFSDNIMSLGTHSVLSTKTISS